MRKKFSIEDLKRITEDEMPAVPKRTTYPWEEIFGSIKEGEAIVIEPEQIHSSTVRTALKRYQDNGKFRNLVMTTRTVSEDRYRSYVLNPSKKKEAE